MEDEVATELGTGQGAAASDSTPSATNPLELDLVMKRILEHVDRRSTLLKCRRLNHQWNDKALGILRGKNVLLELHSGNVEEYLSLVQSTGQKEPSLNISLRIEQRGGDAPRPDLDQQVFFMGILHQLFSIFSQAAEKDTKEGVRFVKILSCTSRYKQDVNWVSIGGLIDRIAGGLRRIQLSEGPRNQQIGTLLLRPTTGFPKLKVLSFGGILKNEVLLPQILKKAPNLTQLEISVEPLDRLNPQTFTLLGQNLARAFNSTISETGLKLEHLTELATPLDSHEIYLALTRLRFPCVEKLRLTFTINADPNSSASLARFLANNCTKLYSLEFDFMLDDVVTVLFDDPRIAEFPGPLPPLPNITHFAYGARQMSPVSLTPIVRLDNLRPKHFPGLRSATVKFDTFLFGTDYLPHSFELDGWVKKRARINNAAFPSVSHLHLKVVDLSLLLDEEQAGMHALHNITVRDVCNQLFMLFPNTRHLHLHLDIQASGLSMENVARLSIAARHLLQEFGGLESLEINSNCINFLTRIITDEIQESTLQQSLKELRIPQAGRQAKEIVARGGASGGEWRGSSEGGIVNSHFVPGRHASLLRLRSVLEWFPHLERLAISEKLVDGENLAQLEANYPNVKIVVVEDE